LNVSQLPDENGRYRSAIDTLVPGQRARLLRDAVPRGGRPPQDASSVEAGYWHAGCLWAGKEA
jgi:hypothetical protein